jgi:hypothetical protein
LRRSAEGSKKPDEKAERPDHGSTDEKKVLVDGDKIKNSAV